MACAACDAKNPKKGYINKSALDFYPLNAVDIEVYDGQETRPLLKEDWTGHRHKLLLFYPETFTPVCTSEMGAVNDWVDAFDEQNCDVFSVTTDEVDLVRDWYENEEALGPLKYRALSSYLLTLRLGLINGQRSKRASVFITNEGDVVVQEHFMRVGRSLKELHRMIYAYNQNSYCAEGWLDPSDGFLSDNH